MQSYDIFSACLPGIDIFMLSSHSQQIIFIRNNTTTMHDNKPRHSVLSTAAAAIIACSLALALLPTFAGNKHPLPHGMRTKLSPGLRSMLEKRDDERRNIVRSASGKEEELRVCAFVQVADSDASVLTSADCRLLAQWGDIFIADIPLSRVASLAAATNVSRIEAERGNTPTLDSMAFFTNASPVYEGQKLPQAYTGRGVVMGIQDIGFDLTHPTFRSSDGETFRISRLWDMLSESDEGSDMYVGREFVNENELLAHAHSRDGITQWHGTHTLGIAAGSGAGSIYKGMAPESDICLVSNAVNGDEVYIDSADFYRYTHATDALGFKYIFDYAQSQGKPCVISFSEGSAQSLHNEDMLYYETLSRMTGPGRIIVSSAGNRGVSRNYVAKPLGRASAGTFCIAIGTRFDVATQSQGQLSVRSILYNVGNFSSTSPRIAARGNDVVTTFSTTDVTSAPDSCLSDTIVSGGRQWVVSASAYPSNTGRGLLAMDITVEGPKPLGFSTPLSIELLGEECSAEMFCQNGEMRGDAADPNIDDAECSHNINSPSAAPAVICVGGTACRPVYDNIDGDKITQWWGKSGERGNYSSVGPTFDGRTKPDVMAPGANIVSARSSVYDELHPTDLKQWTVAEQMFNGRRYGWFVAGGTSMSSPAVAGIIALWLQACPTLSPDDVMGILKRTSKPCGDYGPLPNNYCGYGMIDAYAGLLDVLGLSGIDGIDADNPRGVSINVKRGGVLQISFSETPVGSIGVTIYDTSGRKRMQKRLEGGCREYSVTTKLPAGVYAVHINTADKHQRGSMLVRVD